MINISKNAYEKIAYLFFGGLTTLINIGTYYVLADIIEIHYLIANAAAWVLAVLFAYFTNRKYVFSAGDKGKKDIILEITSFFGFRGLSGLIDMLLMYVMVTLLSINGSLSKILVNIIVVILNYIFSKYIIFKKAD